MFVPIMEIDAMQYASMSSELLRGENYLHFYDNGAPYLDKPPLIFWITAIFFKIFGISQFVYRTPSLCFSILTIYSTYKLSILYYNKSVANISTLILSSCLAFFVLNGDVRTDIYMIGPIMLAVWQLAEYFEKSNLRNLILGTIAISFAMMGKGPLGIIIPITVLGADLLFKSKMRRLCDFRLVLGFIIIILFLLPMSIGLYTQFGFKGLKFFYWDQSFGRITGASSWNNNTGALYLFNVFLYSFLPWTLIFLWSFFEQTKNLIIRGKSISKVEIISYTGFVLPTIFLSMSNYKLPHYIYCVLPFAAIITAFKIESLIQFKDKLKIIYYIQIVISILMLCLIFAISIFAFNVGAHVFILPLFFIFVFSWIFYSKIDDKALRLLFPSIMATFLCSYGYNFGILKYLMDYQTQSKAAKYIIDEELDYDDIYLYKENKKEKSRSFNFYLNRNVKYVNEEIFEKNNKDRILIFTNEKGYEDILNRNYEVEMLQSFEHYKVSKIKKEFINPRTRYNTIKNKYLLKIL